MKGWKWWKCASFKNVVLGHCNIVNNGYQHDSRALHTFVPCRLFGQFLNISSKNVISLKTFNSEFSYIEVWLTDPNSKLLEIQDENKHYFNYKLKCNI